MVQRSGGGKLSTRIRDISSGAWVAPVTNPNPQNYSNKPNEYIGLIVPGTQNDQPDNYDYRLGCYDFRHNNRMMAVMFDGHAKGFVNGQLLNKNVSDE